MIRDLRENSYKEVKICTVTRPHKKSPRGFADKTWRGLAYLLRFTTKLLRLMGEIILPKEKQFSRCIFTFTQGEIKIEQ